MGQDKASAVIDMSRRTLRIPGALSALVATGPEKLNSGFGNGDCLLVDTHRGLFAVADASERHPRASRTLLTGLHRRLCQGPTPPDARTLACGLEQAFARQPFTHKSTLSGICLAAAPEGFTLNLFHGGDSMIMVVEAETGRTLMETSPDMNFAGRSRQPMDVMHQTFSWETSVRILLATDGFGEVLKPAQPADPQQAVQYRWQRIRELVGTPLEEMEQRVRQLLAADPARAFHDDIAVMVIDPAALARLPSLALTMGGTSARQEAAFAAAEGNGRPARKDLAEDPWDDHMEDLQAAGFRMLMPAT